MSRSKSARRDTSNDGNRFYGNGRVDVAGQSAVSQRTQGSRHRSVYNRIDGNDDAIVDRDLRPATFIKELEKKTQEVEDEKE